MAAYSMIYLSHLVWHTSTWQLAISTCTRPSDYTSYKWGPQRCWYPRFLLPVSYLHHIEPPPLRSHLLECHHFASRKFSAHGYFTLYVPRDGSSYFICLWGRPVFFSFREAHPMFRKVDPCSLCLQSGPTSLMFRETSLYFTCSTRQIPIRLFLPYLISCPRVPDSLLKVTHPSRSWYSL